MRFFLALALGALLLGAPSAQAGIMYGNPGTTKLQERCGVRSAVQVNRIVPAGAGRTGRSHAAPTSAPRGTCPRIAGDSRGEAPPTAKPCVTQRR